MMKAVNYSTNSTPALLCFCSSPDKSQRPSFNKRFVRFPSAVRSKFRAFSVAPAAAMTSEMKVVQGEDGYVLQDVPHVTDYISDLSVSCNVG
ncbi:hypothetical protein QQ045_013032 [Rhodiola kirilowii]